MSGHQQSVLVETSGDNVYYNVTFINTNDRGDNIPIEMKFNETRVTPLLPGNTIDYKLSVIKFDIPIDLIPIQFFPTQDGSINESTYSVTISWGLFTHQVFLIWNPENSTAPIPSAPFSLDNKPFYHDYYALYTIEHFMRMINTALASAHAAILADGAPVLVNVPPFLYFESTTNLITLYGPIAYNSDNVNPVTIYFNSALSENFGTSFPSTLVSHSNPQGKDIQLLVHNNNVNLQTINGQQYYAMQQEFTTIEYMYLISEIILVSNSLPVRNEWINVQGSNTNNYLSQLLDYSVNFIGADEGIRRRAFFLPSAQFKYSTLTNNLDIYTIDLQFLWKTRDNILIPIFIGPGKEGSVKLLFEKK